MLLRRWRDACTKLMLKRNWESHYFIQRFCSRDHSSMCFSTHHSRHIFNRRLVSMHIARNSSLEVGHSRFLAEASKDTKWEKNGEQISKGDGAEGSHQVEGIEPGRGKIIATSSHLFKLILPLWTQGKGSGKTTEPPTVFLLHPSQPLSHVARLVASTMAPQEPKVTFCSISRDDSNEEKILEKWSDSTDLGDFVKNASKNGLFALIITTPSSSAVEKGPLTEHKIRVSIPSFPHRTLYLRRRLSTLEADLSKMESIKQHCDTLAHRGARRTAIGGFVALLTYWGVVARLTFWDYGWDVMEPITYLSGLSTVITGYLWFLWHNREVSYTSVLSQNVSSRREALYAEHGLNLEGWEDKKAMARALRREISNIAEEYDEHWEKEDGRGSEITERIVKLEESRKQEEADRH